MLTEESKIFSPYRFLGGICNSLPFKIQNNHKLKENFIITSIGRTWNRFSCSNLAIIEVGEILESEITAIATSGYYIFIAFGSKIRVHSRQSQVSKDIFSPDFDRPFISLSALGDHLLALDSSNCVVVWDYHSGEIYRQLCFDPYNFKITSMLHPSTHLNKFIFGSLQGKLELWNIKTAKMIHSFTSLPTGVKITTLEQSTALDVVAVGYEDGKVVLLNILYDKVVSKLKQKGRVTSLSFSSTLWMASASETGAITFWNLESMVMGGRIKQPHDLCVNSIYFLPNDSVLVSSSSDNSLKTWKFDNYGSATLLHHRAGNSEPVERISFYDDDFVLSADSSGQFRALSVNHDSNSLLLGKYPYHFTEIVSETTRQSDWDSIFCIHRDNQVVTTWNKRKTYSQPRLLENKDMENTSATSVTSSSCGNYALVGHSDGSIVAFNVQSGVARHVYSSIKIKSSVAGIICDIVNSLLISLHSDGIVISWSFYTARPLKVSQLNTSISRVCFNRTRNLIAFTSLDHSIFVLDSSRPHSEPIRHWPEFSEAITGFSFSHDSKWIVLCFVTPVIRILDVPSTNLIDTFYVSSPALSVSFSSNGLYMATCHADDRLVHVWTNASLHRVCSLAENIQNPQVSALENDLVKISSLPPSRWQNIVEYSSIKRRNKEHRVISNVPLFHISSNTAGSKIAKHFRTSLLESNSENFPKFMETLKSMSMSALHLELSLFDSLMMDKFMDFLGFMLTSKKDIDLVLSYLSLFIEKCSDDLRKNKDLMIKLARLGELARTTMEDLNKLVSRCGSIMAYIKSSTY